MIALNKKLKIFLNYGLGPLLFLGLSYSIYRHITRQPNFEEAWLQLKVTLLQKGSWKMVLVVVLMLFNWGFEAVKWKILVNHIQPLSFFTSFKAILSGLSVSLALSTPNGVGEYAGRVLYVKEGNRLRAVSLTLVGSISQLLVTLIMGSLGLLLLRGMLLKATNHLTGLSLLVIDATIYGAVLASATMLLIYFKLSWLIKLVERIPIVKKYAFFIQKLEEFEWPELLKVLFFSSMRYAIFVFQYVLLMQVFGVQIETWYVVWLITVMFLVLAIVPTIALAELGVRGQVSIYLFGLMSTNSLGIVLTASGIWLINIVVPALAGSLFVLGIKFFRNK